jgi:PhoPQ-activated pathogenicity-related protein
MDPFHFSLLLSLVVQCSMAVDWDVVTPLDEYVHRDDGAFKWEELASYNFQGVTVYILNMTSQYYQDPSLVSWHEWWHVMGVAIPDEIQYLDAGILVIEGGSNRNTEVPSKTDPNVVAAAVVANTTGCVSGFILQVPNQPIVFSNDPTQRERSEDRLIAWTWRTFLDWPEEQKDPTVILRMPMTKAAKRGLDTIYEVAKQRRPETDIQRFMVTGASKRGWTTWSIAAVDRRVVVMIPLVFSILNMEVDMMNHYRNMDGAWSFAMRPYYDENITQEFFNPEMEGVYEVEDMLYYKERFTIPLLAMSSSGDEYFLCDENWVWWDLIPSKDKYLMMLPNAEHTMAPHYLQIFETATAFYLNYLDGNPYPHVSWTLGWTPGGGFIDFVTDPPPKSIRGFSAVTLANDTRRDYRLAALNEEGQAVLHPVPWRRNVPIIDLGGGRYRAEAEEVEGEWVGFFIEVS